MDIELEFRTDVLTMFTYLVALGATAFGVDTANYYNWWGLCLRVLLFLIGVYFIFHFYRVTYINKEHLRLYYPFRWSIHHKEFIFDYSLVDNITFMIYVIEDTPYLEFIFKEYTHGYKKLIIEVDNHPETRYLLKQLKANGVQIILKSESSLEKYSNLEL